MPHGIHSLSIQRAIEPITMRFESKISNWWIFCSALFIPIQNNHTTKQTMKQTNRPFFSMRKIATIMMTITKMKTITMAMAMAMAMVICDGKSCHSWWWWWYSLMPTDDKFCFDFLFHHIFQILQPLMNSFSVKRYYMIKENRPNKNNGDDDALGVDCVQ